MAKALIEAAGTPFAKPGMSVIHDTGDERDARAAAIEEPLVPRSPEIMYGLGNLIQNAIEFARREVAVAAPAAVRKSYEQRCLWQWWDRRATILDRDAVSDDVYFVVAGAVRILNYSASGHREVALDEVGAGGYFGEMAAIDDEPRSATVTATAHVDGAAAGESLSRLSFVSSVCRTRHDAAAHRNGARYQVGIGGELN